MPSLIIHGHFYQPPRENPWNGEVEREEDAAPYHDWNEKIHAECYRPNAFAPILDSACSILRTINNYANISFNFGPTLLSWLERHHPETYQRILEADRVSFARRGGHGNAIAQSYGHAILPLLNDRDRATQVRWGIAEFRYRFARFPESLWLPETACNNKTLDLLIDEGLRYVILAPAQAKHFRKIGENGWHSVVSGSIDDSKAYRYSHNDNSGRSIAVFFYNGQIARAIAFENALSSSQSLAGLLQQVVATRAMVNVATDGETYGHHFKFGDLCLAHLLEVEAPQAGFQVTNYGQYLDWHPPVDEIRVSEGQKGEGSSWSCPHGVDRWIRSCGCYTGGQQGWNQEWRGPLRDAFEFLHNEAATAFESLGGDLLVDPWKTRDAYIEIVLGNKSHDDFARSHFRRSLRSGDIERAFTLLEIQRNSLFMFTSCGWFFSDLSGIETIQVIKYAARVIELMESLKLPSPRSKFLAMMSAAKSNIKERGTGADIYLRLVK